MTTDAVRMDTAKGRWILLATVLGSGMAQLDATVVNVALNRIGVELDADFAGLQWIVNAYTLTLAALILLGGALGDRYGRRRVFLLGVTWFALASLLCAVAPSAGFLVAARALQGIGGALLTPGSLAMIAASFDPADRSKAVGAWSAFGGIAGAIGPFVGGWLVEWDWRMVFLINLPLAVLVIIVARLHVPESRDPATVKGFDITGTVLGAAGLGILTYGLISAGRSFGPFVLLMIVGGLVVLGAFLVVERRSSHPLVALDLFTNRTFTAINLVTFVVYAALGVFFFLLVLDLQVVVGFSPLAAGTALLPVTVIMLLLSSRSGALADRIGARIPLTVGPLLAACGLLLTLRIGPGSTYLGGVVPPVLVFGLGLSLTVAPLTATVLASAPARHAGIASGVNNAVARAAGLLSVAVIPVVAGLSGQAYAHSDAMSDGFKMAMMVSAVLLILGGLLAWALVRAPSQAAVPTAGSPAAAGEVAAPVEAPSPVPVAPVPGGVPAARASRAAGATGATGAASADHSADTAAAHHPTNYPADAAASAHHPADHPADATASADHPAGAAARASVSGHAPAVAGAAEAAGGARTARVGSVEHSADERDQAAEVSGRAPGAADGRDAAAPTGTGGSAGESAPFGAGRTPGGTAPVSAAPTASTDAAAAEPTRAGAPRPVAAVGPAADRVGAPEIELAKCLHCGITGPQLYPTDPALDR